MASGEDRGVAARSPEGPGPFSARWSRKATRQRKMAARCGAAISFDAGQRRGAWRSAAAEARIARAVGARLGAEALALAEAFALRTIAERRAVALRTRLRTLAALAIERR